MKHVASTKDMSYSMLIDGTQQYKNKIVKLKHKKLKLRNVEPKVIYHWVEDNQVKACYNCKKEFGESYWGYFTGKHHCRNCGRIFCDKCSSKRIYLQENKKHKIIEYIQDITTQIANQTSKNNQNNQNNQNNGNNGNNVNNVNNSITGKKQRVCNSCYRKLKEYELILPYITNDSDVVRRNLRKNSSKILCSSILDYLDIKDYFKIACLNKVYNKVAMNYFSKFREIQYKPFIDLKYDDMEKLMLLNNFKYFSGHNKLLTHFIQSIDWSNIPKALELKYVKMIQTSFKNRKKCHCWNLMCTRICKPTLDLEDTLNILANGGDYYNNILLNIILEPLIASNDGELKYYLTILFQILPDIIKITQIYSSQLIQILFDKASQSNVFAFHIFWCLYLYCQGTRHISFYNRLFKYYVETRYEILKFNMIQQKNLIEYILAVFNEHKGYSSDLVTRIKRKLIQCDEYFIQFKKECHDHFQFELYCNPIITNPMFECINIKFVDKKTRLIDSASRPLIIPCVVRNSVGKKFKYEIMYKQDDLRQEKLIMDIISLMDIILKKEENLNLYITTYNIVPINNKEGFIEIISSAVTLSELKKRGVTIQNYIQENNPNILTSEWKTRFANSCAACCVISYLLGIGDRHLRNIMLTNKGYLFHVDYGYILGSDPKYMAPEIRTTPEMVDALGGEKSIYYKDFKNKCIKAYNCLRRHANLFMLLLTPLYMANPDINNGKFTKQVIAHQILKRFIPNENNEEAKLNFITKVEESHTTHSSSLIDIFQNNKKDIYLFKDDNRLIDSTQKKMSRSNSKSVAMTDMSDPMELIEDLEQESPNNKSISGFLSMSALKQSIMTFIPNRNKK